jgi:hypothetical protein
MKQRGTTSIVDVPTAPANVKYNILKALLRAGASVHGRGKYGTSNLTKAITSSSSAYPHQPTLMGFVKQLLDAGANPWLSDANGKSAFEVAISMVSSNYDAILLMLEGNQGVPVVGAATVLNKCVSFFNAALTAGHWMVVHAMLNAGMDVLSQGVHGITPLKHMYTSCGPATVSQLLGCVPGSKSGLGMCSIDLVQRNMVDMLKVIEDAGADLGCAVDGDSGANTLMLAARSTVPTQLATVLLDSGVPVDNRSQDQRF